MIDPGDRGDPEFSKLCMEACSTAVAYGYIDLSVEFAICQSEDRFLRLLDLFDQYGTSGNAVGDYFHGELRALRLVNNIANRLDNDDGV